MLFYDCTDIPTSWGVNPMVEAARVNLLTKRPGVLELPSTSKAE